MKVYQIIENTESEGREIHTTHASDLGAAYALDSWLQKNVFDEFPTHHPFESGTNEHIMAIKEDKGYAVNDDWTYEIEEVEVLP